MKFTELLTIISNNSNDIKNIKPEKNATSKKSNPVVNNQNAKKNLRKIAFVTKLPNEYKIDSNFLEEVVLLASYSDPFLKNQTGYTTFKVLYNKQNQKTYIREQDIPFLKSQLGISWPKILTLSEDNESNKVPNNFKWPSTELTGIKMAKDVPALKEESVLKSLGYQITGSTREKRWRVLDRGVKELGLQKVAYTIARNVKFRKGQKGGENKYSFAIGEWEYVLEKLKKLYYRNNFKWPPYVSKGSSPIYAIPFDTIREPLLELS